MLQEASFYKSTKNNTVECRLCSKFCKIKEGYYGFCKSRFNKQGKLYLDNYHKIASFNIDPIEKKPLYHFLPNSSTLSIGGFGCNFSCLNCQNYMLANNSYQNNNTTKILPETIVKTALNNNCMSIAWTYNEASLYFEFARETSILAHNNNLKNVYVSNGYMSNESLKETLKFIDAFNIDLKSFNNNFYKDICGGSLNPVLNNLKTIYNSNKHLEITTLLIDDLNTSKEELKMLCNFIYNELGSEVPLHFSRFFPMNKMNDKNPTKIPTLEKAKEIAIDTGLEYVYLGNVNTDKNSYCPNCGELLISRIGYCNRDKKRIKDGHCTNCGHKLNFVLD